MAITGISSRAETALAQLRGGDDPGVQALANVVLDLARAVEELSADIDRLADGRSRASGVPPRS